MARQANTGCMYCSDEFCTALITRDCTNCSFCLTHDQREKKRQKAFKRLRQLDIPKQEIIAQKYYGGAMPWRY